MAVGQKVKYYRERADMSQFDLETEIAAARGSLSRIEKGKVDPQKATLINIAFALNLRNHEVATLFGLETLSEDSLQSTMLDILESKDLDDVCSKIVDDLILRLGYIASTLFLLKDNGKELYTFWITKSDISAKVLQFLDKPLNEYTMPYSDGSENLIIKAMRSGKPIVTNYSREYLAPFVSTEVADAIQAVTGDKSNLVYPLIADGELNGESIGAVVYVTKYETDFKEDLELLGKITPRLARAVRGAQ